MPFDKNKYHPQWDLIRNKTLDKAGHKCEICGVPNHSFIFRGTLKSGKDEIEAFQDMDGIIFRTSDGASLGSGYLGTLHNDRGVKIVLTISHQDHNIDNNSEDNLKALCQLHHLRHDKEHHRNTRKNKKNQLDLFT
jgi:hypothetical protein